MGDEGGLEPGRAGAWIPATRSASVHPRGCPASGQAEKGSPLNSGDGRICTTGAPGGRGGVPPTGPLEHLLPVRAITTSPLRTIRTYLCTQTPTCVIY